MINKSLHFTWVYAGDGLHLSAVSLLILWILHKKTCKGISGRTQIIAALVDFLQFGYAAASSNDIYLEAPDYYSLIMTGVSSAVSGVLMYVMFKKYKKTIEKDFDTFWIEVLIILCGGFALVANPVYMEAEDKSQTDPLEVIFYMSLYLDSVSILPQIYFNFRTGSKTLCMSLYVLLSTLATFFYMYYLVTAYLDTDTDIDFDKLEVTPKYTIYPECGQLVCYALFFIMLVIVPKYEEVLPLPLCEVESTTGSSVDGEKAEECNKNCLPVIVVTRPQLDRQQSLLETPFLKKSLPSSASLINTNPDGSQKLSFAQAKIPRPQSKPNISRIMQLTHLKRAQTTASELFALGTMSAPSTPEDDFKMFQTALQSRQRRLELVRRRSLPTTPTVSDVETSPSGGNGSNERVIFNIGDEDDGEITKEVHRRKHRKTLSFERFLAAQMLRSKQAAIHLEENNRYILDPPTDSGPKSTNSTNKGDASDVPIGVASIKTERTDPDTKTKKDSTTKKPAPKVSDSTVRKNRRATVYHPAPHSLQMQNNWKMLATNFLGTGPIDVRQPSVQDPSIRDQARKPRRNRIFSVA